VTRTHQAHAVRRLVVTVIALAVGGAGFLVSGLLSATGASLPAATPQGPCLGPQKKVERDLQGRVPPRDYASGRAAKGYRCNTAQVSHRGRTGGFKVLRYTDSKGNTCAFYDSTRLFPSDTLFTATEGQGVVVLDMKNPAKPKKVANLQTPAMLSPHESLLLNQRRGLLVAALGNAFTNVGLLEVYDVRTDCREPVLLSATPDTLLGHESGFAPDGKTFYAVSTGGQTFVAIDLTDPTAPQRIFEQFNVNYHGLRLSEDGRTLYAANIGNDLSGADFPGEGLRILDVSEIQDRKPDPRVRVISNLVWPERSIPQVAQPFRRGGRDYLLQVDEFARRGLGDSADASVGAARIIEVTDPARPKVISNLRLQVHQPAGRRASISDPGASSPVGGYAGHYCSAPYRDNPRIVACSMLASGLRVFDISNLRRPVEVAYFNEPFVPSTPLSTKAGANAFSQPAWDVRRRSIWYTDGNTGFYVVRLTNGIGKLLAR